MLPGTQVGAAFHGNFLGRMVTGKLAGLWGSPAVGTEQLWEEVGWGVQPNAALAEHGDNGRRKCVSAFETNLSFCVLMFS